MVKFFSILIYILLVKVNLSPVVANLRERQEGISWQLEDSTGQYSLSETHRGESRRLITLITIGNNGEPPEVFPLGRCQGDCDSDDECAVGLQCFQRNDVEPVPGCYGEGKQGIDYCYDPNITTVEFSTGSTTTLTVYGVDGAPAAAYPLGQCEGVCHTNDDCADGLVCMIRSGFENVPGCQGQGVYQKGYCYNPDQQFSTETLSPTPTSTNTPTSTPVAGPTKAPVPTTPLPSAAPSATAMPSPQPSDLPALALVGDNGQPSTAFPLGKCEGDCDDDSDCADGLYCFPRTDIEEVPGCSGTGSPGRDYCFDNMDYPPNNNGGGPAFRLKKYWQVGYYWQETHVETKWCLVCHTRCKLETCSPDSTRFDLIADGDLGAQLKIADDSNECLERVRARAIETLTCDATNARQYFTGAFNERNFEIHPHNQTYKCLTSQHQPKEDEVVFADWCYLSRRATASLWIKY